MPLRSFAAMLMVVALAGCTSGSGTADKVPMSATADGATAANALPPPSFDRPVVPGSEYRLGALDTVGISVFQAPEISGEFQVGSDGQLMLPLVGSIRAQGLTSLDIQNTVTTKLKASYMQSPQVIVKVTGFNSQKVVVDGSVAKPGAFSVAAGGGTLLQYIALAGGMPRTAQRGNVAVFRTVGNERMVARFNVDQIRSGKMADPQIYGGDTIVVPQSGIRSAWSDILQALPAASFVTNVTGL